MGLPAGKREPKKKRAQQRCAPTKAEVRRLFEFFDHYGELQLGLGEGLDDSGLGGFGSGVAGGGHFTDQEVLGALEHLDLLPGTGTLHLSTQHRNRIRFDRQAAQIRTASPPRRCEGGL